jgi:hypothetical protein
MVNRVILWGLWVCLALLAAELALLAVSGNWFVLTVTLVAVGGVAAAIYATVRQVERSRRPGLGRTHERRGAERRFRW